jgi:hypothetical protein
MNLARLRQAEVDPVPWLGNIDVALRIREILHQRSRNRRPGDSPGLLVRLPM